MKNVRILLRAVLLILVLAVAFAIGVYAADSGYALNATGAETNIKWEVKTEEENTILSFTIDASATGKAASTVLGGSSFPWKDKAGSVTHIKIGNGITEIDGAIAKSFSNLLYVEIPKSLKAINNAAFDNCRALTAVYYTGSEPTDGICDLATVTTLGEFVFSNCRSIKEFKFSENLTGSFGREAFKITGMEKLTIPKGVTNIGPNSFYYNSSLSEIWVYAENYTLEANAFTICQKINYVYGIPGTPFEEWCRTNDVSFRNINNPKEYIFKSSKADEIFDPETATDYARLVNYWNDQLVCDTTWAYYEETQTLRFFSNYPAITRNETGNYGYAIAGFKLYADKIEHIIIGDGIHFITGMAFTDMTALKTVELGKDVRSMGTEVFWGCTSLTTIYRKGTTPVEGTADLSGLASVTDRSFKSTAIRDFIFNKSIASIGENWMSNRISSITCVPTEELIQFGVDNFVDIIDINTGETVSKNAYEVDWSLPTCGNRVVYSFDEATGTLTISGAGPMNDIVNYYGGGSKTQWWFDYKQSIKKVVIAEGISYIGKYAFTQCKNLEYVELPSNSILIGNAAFEECVALKSIYVRGNDPIVGHIDLSTVAELNSWTFSKCYLIANATISEEVYDIGSSVFDSCVNLSGVYGTIGSYAEEFAMNNDFTFFDSDSSTPVDTICEAPEETTAGLITMAPMPGYDETTAPDTETETETTAPITEDNTKADVEPSEFPVVIVVVIAVVLVVSTVVAIIVIKKKKK